jgi:5'-nucleotidase
MQSRRKFLFQTGVLVGAAYLLPNTVFAADKKRISVLHTNDFHSHIDPFPANHPVWPGEGGAAKIKTLIDEAKKENPNALILDSGDIFQGTPYFNVFGGVAELEWMNKAGYMAGTLGNHEFDNGVDKLTEVLKHANFPIVNCNYEINNTALRTIIKTHCVLEIATKKIGITGVGIDLSNLILENNRKGIVYKDPVIEVQKIVKKLRTEEKCDMVIVLSHLGYEYADNTIDDKKLASKTDGIDLILGGHTHTFLQAPIQVKNRNNKYVTINQAGWAGLLLGKLNFEV